MQTYREPSQRDVRHTVSFGEGRHRLLVAFLGALLLSISLGATVGFFVLLGWKYGAMITAAFVVFDCLGLLLARYLRVRGGGPILLPALAGLDRLLRRRSGTIEYVQEREELHVELRSVLGRQQVVVPVSDVTGLTLTDSIGETVPAIPDRHLLLARVFSVKGADPELDLRLQLATGRSLSLLRSSDAHFLEAARAAVSAFLIENALVRTPRPNPKARIHFAEGNGNEEPADDATTVEADAAARGRDATS